MSSVGIDEGSSPSQTNTNEKNFGPNHYQNDDDYLAHDSVEQLAENLETENISHLVISPKDSTMLPKSSGKIGMELSLIKRNSQTQKRITSTASKKNPSKDLVEFEKDLFESRPTPEEYTQSMNNMFADHNNQAKEQPEKKEKIQKACDHKIQNENPASTQSNSSGSLEGIAKNYQLTPDNLKNLTHSNLNKSKLIWSFKPAKVQVFLKDVYEAIKELKYEPDQDSKKLEILKRCVEDQIIKDFANNPSKVFLLKKLLLLCTSEPKNSINEALVLTSKDQKQDPQVEALLRLLLFRMNYCNSKSRDRKEEIERMFKKSLGLEKAIMDLLKKIFSLLSARQIKANAVCEKCEVVGDKYQLRDNSKGQCLPNLYRYQNYLHLACK